MQILTYNPPAPRPIPQKLNQKLSGWGSTSLIWQAPWIIRIPLKPDNYCLLVLPFPTFLFFNSFNPVPGLAAEIKTIAETSSLEVGRQH